MFKDGSQRHCCLSKTQMTNQSDIQDPIRSGDPGWLAVSPHLNTDCCGTLSYFHLWLASRCKEDSLKDDLMK